MGDINKAVKFMIDIANDDTHGYDQTNRNSPDYDCSSLVGTALNYAGFNVSKYSWTGNLRKQLLNSGFFELPVDSERQCGDIFLTEGKHVVMCVDSDTIVHASINEKGTATGGKTGDQTGKEICVRSFYIPTYGWQYHFRYQPIKSELDVALEVISGEWDNGKERVKRLTDSGYDYISVQNLVNYLLNSNKTELGQIAREVIAGKWGNGDERKAKLTNAGLDYEIIQILVNDMLKG